VDARTYMLWTSRGTSLSIDYIYIIFLLQLDDCFLEYNYIARVPKATNVSVNAFRQFFNAYLVHKLFMDHLMKFTPHELLYNGWVDQTNVYDLIKQLAKLKHTLQYNLKSLAVLVSYY